VAEVIHQVLAEAVSEAPEREALRYRRTSWTYAQLGMAADALTRALVGAGIRPGDRVGYWAPKRPEAVAALYGTMQAGAVWVPIDPNAPRPWVEAVVADCGVAGFVTTAERAGILARGPRRPRIVLLLPGDEGERPDLPHVAWDDAMASPSTTLPADSVAATDMAAIFYTSGSTGVPKGVVHHHRSLMLSASWFTELSGMGVDDRMPVLPPLHFKMSMYGLVSPALARATSILVSLESGFRGRDLARLVRDERVTIWRSVTHPLQVLASTPPAPGSLASIRSVTLGGGGWRPADVPVMREAAPRAALWQTYGTTESGTICAHAIEGPVEAGQRIPVGRPVEHARVVHLREDGSVAGSGEEGEMVVWSPKIMLGYWGDRARTDAVLVPDPTGREPGQRWLRTGDLVRLRPDGAYEFVGRRDEMVKSRGYRVELGQVESALASHPSVRDSAAAARPHPEWGSAIVAFAALSGGATEAELRTHVAQQLPVYMVPQRIHILPVLPRTSSGKLDRRRLLAQVEGGGSPTGGQGGRPEAEVGRPGA
jgi:amino acid adenylation domain-containing protein